MLGMTLAAAKPLRRLLLSTALLGPAFLLAPSSLYANSVHSCKEVTVASNQKSGASKNITRCVVEISSGKVGDVVEIKNQYNYIVASGRLIKRDGRYGVIVVSRLNKEIKTGYPVFIRNSDSNDYWTATTSPI